MNIEQEIADLHTATELALDRLRETKEQLKMIRTRLLGVVGDAAILVRQRDQLANEVTALHQRARGVPGLERKGPPPRQASEIPRLVPRTVSQQLTDMEEAKSPAAIELPVFPSKAIGCSREECGFVPAGIGFQCREHGNCGRYIHPTDPGFDELAAYDRTMTTLSMRAP